jgi:hypothetical protein
VPFLLLIYLTAQEPPLVIHMPTEAACLAEAREWRDTARVECIKRDQDFRPK